MEANPMKVRSLVRVRALAAASLLAALALTGPATIPAAAQSPQSLRTAAEESGFERHTRHPELLEYLRALRAASPGCGSATTGASGRDCHTPSSAVRR